MSRLPPPPPGPIETNEFAQRLAGRVVSPGARPRLHGYDVQGDLASHYRFADVALLAATRELPRSDLEARAFEVCLVFLSAAPIAEPPAHLAALTRMCGGTDAAVLGTGALALAEQAQDFASRHAELLAWLGAPAGRFPEEFRARGGDDRAAVARLAGALAGAGLDAPGFDEDPTLEAALVCALRACGLSAPHQLATAFVVARLPAVAAEGFAVRGGHLQLYPIDLPHYAYEEPDDV
jgi:hypothetical protein